MNRPAAASALAVLLACAGAGGGESVQRHKLQVSPDQAAELLRQGGKLIADYGAFQLVEVDGALRASTATGPSVQPRDEYDLVLLNAGTVDTTTPHGASLRGVDVPDAGKRFHLVQLAGPIRPEWYAALETTGVRVVTYVPHNAYLVYGDAAALARLRELIAGSRVIQWDGVYLAAHKVDPSVHARETGAYSIQLVEDPDANPATLALIDRLAGAPSRVQRALGYVDVVARSARGAAEAIALRPDVISIQPYLEPALRCERVGVILSGQLTAAGTAPAGPGYLGWLASRGFTQAQFTASGFAVDLTDSGVDNAAQSPNHFGLYEGGDVLGPSRVVYHRLEGLPNPGSTVRGCDGHGTINAHILGGFSSQAGAPFTDAQGYGHGVGVAPFVRIGASVIFDPVAFTSPVYEHLQARAYRDGARISANGWGANSNLYSTDSQRYDALVRDAQPAGSAVPTPGNQEMVIVFAAGNRGAGAGTVGFPGTGKNVLTVGASENVRPFGGVDGCSADDEAADSAMDVLSTSSRGPTADGRRKPELMAPGTHVGGGAIQADGQRASPPASALGQVDGCFDATRICGGDVTPFYPDGQEWYVASTGTSHAAPAAAGAAALLRQHFINQGLTPPSPAMTKGFLMGSARYMTGAGANDTLHSNSQGMGLLDLGMAFDGAGRLLSDQEPANLFTASGQTRVFTGYVSDPSRPFRVTLAWTDAPGSTTGAAYRNDLDLVVTVGGATYLGNVFSGARSITGGTADPANNVESVFLPAGVTGPFTVTVTAMNINSDGVPGSGTATDQDFALVVYNRCTTAPATAPNGLTATAPVPNQIDLAWSTVPGATDYVVYRSVTSGGPYVQVGVTDVSSYADTGISGGTTYHYVVRGRVCAESGPSAEVSVTATGPCTLPPSFAGLASAANGAASTCTTHLTWPAATPACGGAVTYSVYRSQSGGFVPSAANRIATGLSGTTFADIANLSNRTTYHYVVRATEAAREDANTVERSAMPTGAITTSADFFDDFDGSRPPDAAAWWTPATFSGASGTLNITSGCHFQSPTGAYRFGAASTSCGGTYPGAVSALLKLGGNGTTAGVDGFSIPASPLNARMMFHLWYRFETRFDGATLVYSTAGAAGPYLPVPDTAMSGQPYLSAGGYDGVLAVGGRGWTGSQSSSNGDLKPVFVDLAPLAGRRVWFGFQFTSDSSASLEGLYLDDVRVLADSAASCGPTTVPAGLAFQVQPGPATAGSPVAPAVEVRVVDGSGALVSTATDAVTLSIGANPGGGALVGATTVNAAGGVATFPGLSIDRPGAGYTLAATAAGLAGATSAVFDVTAPSVAPPSIAITFPADGDIVNGRVDITAAGAAAPGASLVRIDVLVDGEIAGSSATSPAVVPWGDVTVLDDSSHVVTAIAVDNAGRAAVSSPVNIVYRSARCGCRASGVDAGGALAVFAAAIRVVLARRRRL